MKRRPVALGYEPLARVLEDALAQASRGKGKQRHDKHGKHFLMQPMQRICQDLDSEDFALGQAIKKILESRHLSRERGERDLLGAINYVAGAVLARRQREAGQKKLTSARLESRCHSPNRNSRRSPRPSGRTPTASSNASRRRTRKRS